MASVDTTAAFWILVSPAPEDDVGYGGGLGGIAFNWLAFP